jgi:hypothetical protein
MAYKTDSYYDSDFYRAQAQVDEAREAWKAQQPDNRPAGVLTNLTEESIDLPIGGSFFGTDGPPGFNTRPLVMDEYKKCASLIERLVKQDKVRWEPIERDGE